MQKRLPSELKDSRIGYLQIASLNGVTLAYIHTVAQHEILNELLAVDAEIHNTTEGGKTLTLNELKERRQSRSRELLIISTSVQEKINDKPIRDKIKELEIEYQKTFHSYQDAVQAAHSYTGFFQRSRADKIKRTAQVLRDECDKLKGEIESSKKELERKYISIESLTDEEVEAILWDTCVSHPYLAGNDVILSQNPYLCHGNRKGNPNKYLFDKQINRATQMLIHDGLLQSDTLSYSDKLPSKYISAHLTITEIAAEILPSLIEALSAKGGRILQEEIQKKISDQYDIPTSVVQEALVYLIQKNYFKLSVDELKLTGPYQEIKTKPMFYIEKGAKKEFPNPRTSCIIALITVLHEIMMLKGLPTSDISVVDKMDGREFEFFCADLLRKSGFINVEVTRSSGDQGVDIVAVKDSIRYAIQCKCYSKDLGNTPIQEVNAGKVYYKCHVGVVLTNRYFTAGAHELAEATGVLLWDRDDLIQMINNSRRLCLLRGTSEHPSGA